MFIKKGDESPVTIIKTEQDLDKAEKAGEISTEMAKVLKKEIDKSVPPVPADKKLGN